MGWSVPAGNYAIGILFDVEVEFEIAVAASVPIITDGVITSVDNKFQISGTSLNAPFNVDTDDINGFNVESSFVCRLS